MNKIYLVTYVSWDGYHRDDTLTEDYGYFTSQEAVEAWVNARNGNREGYDRYVAAREADQATYDEAYALAADRWKTLEAAGLQAGAFMSRPTKPKEASILSYEEWTARQEARYGWVEVEPHEEV